MSTFGVLSDKQKKDLNIAILTYLKASGLNNSYDSVRQELGLEDLEVDLDKNVGLLEKKWSSVVRLQKKILDLEATVFRLQTDLNNAESQPSLSKGKDDRVNWLPKSPAKHTLIGHEHQVTAVAFHGKYNIVASSSEDPSIKIWDWELCELERTLKGHTQVVHDVDFSTAVDPNGPDLLVSCSNDLTIKLWDCQNEYKNTRTLIGHDHTISSVRFIASKGGLLIASCSRDKTVRIWEVKTGYGLRVIKGHSDWVRTIEPTIDGQWLISGGNDHTARLWSIDTGSCKAVFEGHQHVIECCAIAPRTARQHLLQMAQFPTMKGDHNNTNTNNNNNSNDSRFTLGPSNFFATGSRDKTIKLWDDRGQLIKTLVGHDNWVRALAFHPGGRYLISAADDRSIRCWDLSQQARQIRSIDNAHKHFISCLRWIPDNPAKRDGKNTNNIEAIRCIIATGSVDTNVKIWM